MGPAERRAARGMPVPGIGADLSGGPASATLALLAAGLPGMPGTVLGHGTGAGQRLLAVTFNDLAVGGREAELERWPARSPPGPGCTTSWSPAARRPCRTPNWTAR
ncbi:hypothetical protein SGLAM104S_01048 [Streptomyces glaucescens]